MFKRNKTISEENKGRRRFNKIIVYHFATILFEYFPQLLRLENKNPRTFFFSELQSLLY